MRALLRELRPVDHGADADPVLAPGSLDEVASYGLRRALQRLLAVLAPETPEVRLDFRAIATRRSSAKRRCTAFARKRYPNALRHSGARIITIRAQALDHDGWCASRSRMTAAASTSARAPPTARAGGGLGMQTMRERAAALGGTTTIDSAPGKGTRVSSSFPGTTDEHSVPDEIHAERSRRVRVLLVDDHAIVREGLRALLEDVPAHAASSAKRRTATRPSRWRRGCSRTSC